MNKLLDSWELSLFEETVSILIHDLGAISPKEIFLRPLNQPCREVPKLSLLNFLSFLFKQFFSVKDIVFLAVSQLLRELLTILGRRVMH